MSGLTSSGGEEPDDPLIGEFMALRQAVADQLRATARLETVLGQVQDEVARKTGPEQFKETFAAIRQDIIRLAERVDRQEAAFSALPDANAIASAVREATVGLIQNGESTRAVVQESALAAHTAAGRARDAASDAADHVRKLSATVLNDRKTVALAFIAMLVLAVLGGAAGWALRGWWAPPPSAVFARYLAAGNNPDWLLCGGTTETQAQRFTASNGAPACDLKFWLKRPGP
jgi:hypothetical protein